MIRLILILLYVTHASTADEIYQNSSKICEQCTCIDSPDTDEFTLDCNNRKMITDVLANWPPHNRTTLIAIFSYNNITTLKLLPPTNQTVHLVFDHCNIKYMDPNVFAAINDVELIDLSYNLLTTEQINGQEFKAINSKNSDNLAVKYLNLAFNKLHSLPRKLFEYMPDVEELSLAGNDFPVLDDNTQQALNSLKKLRVLNLSHNSLTELVEYAISGLKNLEEIDLSFNKIDVVPETLVTIKNNLKILKLSGNYIFHIDDKSFLGLNLREVHLNNLPRLKIIAPNAFATMKDLKKLFMSNNTNLRGIDRDAFASNQSLDELYLNMNAIQELDYHLLNWSTLKIFEIRDNPLICDCNLFNITQRLSLDITRNKKGPSCIHSTTHLSEQIFALKEDICIEESKFGTVGANRNFTVMRIIVITLCSLLSIATLIAMTIVFLRYRRGSRNYPFTAQVSYNRITRQMPL